MSKPIFLNAEQVMAIHHRSLAAYGGADGLRSPSGFESAVMQPQNDYCYGGADLFGIAAAYAYHIAESQAFVDGNKRTALGAAMLFLEMHRISTVTATKDLHEAMLAIANHEMTKADLAHLFRKLFT